LLRIIASKPLPENDACKRTIFTIDILDAENLPLLRVEVEYVFDVPVFRVVVDIDTLPRVTIHHLASTGVF
jgi:hypothetical protein